MKKYDLRAWANQLITLLILIVVFSLIFNLYRIAFFIDYNESAINLHALLNDWWLGIRLDLKTSALMLFPYFLITPLLTVTSPKLSLFIKKSLVVWTTICLGLLLLLASVNHFYYASFNTFIDNFIFDFLDTENFINVGKTLLTGYPLIPSLLAIGLVIYVIQRWLIKRLFATQWLRPDISKAKLVLSIITISIVYLLVARGAINARPLTLGRAPVSGTIFYNKLMPNGVWAFYEAYKERGNVYQFFEPDLEAVKRAIASLTSNSVTTKPRLSDLLVRSRAPKNMERPHVVLVVMESFGSHALSFHSKYTNLLGRFEKHIDEDYLFNNFYAASMTTANSLDKLLIGHPFDIAISSGRLQHHKYLASYARIFKKAGYKTIFVTSGRKNFTNLGPFYANQGFDHIADEYTIREQIPEAKGGRAWGIYDEYGYRYVEKQLTQSQTPLFIVYLTTTNHSPFEPPADYTPYPLDTGAIEKVSVLSDTEKLQRMMVTFQYAADAFGGFMDRIKSDTSLKSWTIVAATGDHYLRHVFNYDQNIATLSNKYRVPFYLYLPENWRPTDKVDTQLHGSHRDILPTLINRALPGSKYFALGYDLLGGNNRYRFAFNQYFAIDDQAALEITAQGNRYFKVLDNGALVATTADHAAKLQQSWADYRQLLHWLIQCQVKQIQCQE